MGSGGVGQSKREQSLFSKYQITYSWNTKGRTGLFLPFADGYQAWGKLPLRQGPCFIFKQSLTLRGCQPLSWRGQQFQRCDGNFFRANLEAVYSVHAIGFVAGGTKSRPA